MNALPVIIGPTPEDRALAVLERLKAELAEATTIEEVNSVRNMAAAARELAAHARCSREIIQMLVEYRLQAERRLGQLLAELPGLGQRGGDRKSKGIVSLDSLGISRDDSKRCQRFASLPEAQFYGYIAAAKQSRRGIVFEDLLKLAKKHAARAVVQHPATATAQTGVWTDLAALVETDQRFGAIYIDPPWRYDNEASRGAAENHYGTMSVEEIAALPVGILAAEQSHLHLWATEPFLEEAIELLKGWGFERKPSLIWTKPQLGLGNFWRVSHEILLPGVRGGAPFRDHSIRSWQEFPRGAHSEKPEEIRALVERVSPGPYLELFARRAVPGWTVWGNQVAADARREAS